MVLTPVFALLFYFAAAVLLVGVVMRVTRYARTPAPLVIPTTPAPTTRVGVAARMTREVVFFESLFKGNKWTWLFGYLFHFGMLFVLLRHLRYFTDFGHVPTVPDAEEGDAAADTARYRDLLSKPIDDCGLSVRSINSLKNSSISTLGDLVQYTEEDMLKVKNVGEKALGEIKDMLEREELGFGMTFEEIDGELVVTNPGSAAVQAGDPVESESE